MQPDIEYGIFRLGQFWRVTSLEHSDLAFSSLEQAVAATKLMLSAHRASGQRARAIMQTDEGRLVSVPEPF